MEGGAALFGYLHDRLGRKYTFLMTITLMGLATAAIAFIPSEAAIGAAATIILIRLRLLQGLALGGEYGGAAICVRVRPPKARRGYFTYSTQACIPGHVHFATARFMG